MAERRWWRRRRRKIVGRGRSGSVQAVRVQHLPRHRAGAVIRRCVRFDRQTDQRPDREGRRCLHSRIHTEPLGEDCGWLYADHADVPGTVERRTNSAAHRPHQVTCKIRRRRTKGGETMSQAVQEVGVLPRVHYLNASYGWKTWLFTTDHKRIAWLYLAAITFFFFVGGAAVTLMRLNLIEPQGSLIEPSTYNRMFTLHGLVMIFFFLAPSVPAVLGNFLIPLMIGAKDVAFPRLNLLSWYIYSAGGTVLLYSVIAGGGVNTCWTFYTPLSSTYANSNVMSAAMGVFISGFSTILTGLNFIVTIHTMRAPGLTWFRLPLFLWSLYATSLILILATPVVGVAMILVAVERATGVGIFDPALGGDPILFQHLFWFYSHPVVYVMILPAMGTVSEIVTTFSRKTVFGYKFVAFASIAIAVLGFLVWGHHMFVAGQSLYASTIFSLLSFLVAIPSAVKVFNWTATLYRGSVSFLTPMLYAFGFIARFPIGG